MPNDEARRCPTRQFYQHYFTATAKLCWLRWLSVPQRLTMLEELMQWDDRNSES
ncbi:TPA: glucose uptake inhibitor SgrT [Escherichia coli]|uniref:glucose uptake inhibitor SgrT n=1 Tax=Escherichia coli TaxID=562 RepID=UPI001BCABC5E|nr:glucose uptake inhibitor SgrT [Escherichia coli]MDF4181888.1 glucose uptake inhibitor SgrT [Escherichia coli]HCP6340530.1 glucose uptake inhibitor SgrT [Escherichia coli]